MDPPFVGTAVKVTDEPVQIVFPGLAVILTVGETLAETAMEIMLEFTIKGEAQLAFDVKLT